MVDATIQGIEARVPARPRSSLRKAMQRKSTVAFLMALPLILLILLIDQFFDFERFRRVGTFHFDRGLYAHRSPFLTEEWHTRRRRPFSNG